MDTLEQRVQEMFNLALEKRNEFRRIVKSKNLEAIKSCCLSIHKDVHFGDVYDGEETVCDYVFNDLSDETFAAMPIKKHMTIAWCFWHLYRIEDMISNLLIANQKQIYNEDWHRSINAGIYDTGNALSYKETLQISRQMNRNALKEYAVTVGRNTVLIIKALTEEDLARKPFDESLQKIIQQGGLTENKHSAWLLNYWGGLTIGGLLTVPITGHHMMHLPGCVEIRKLAEQSR